MSFFTSLSGLKGAQADLGVISNNVANVASIGFKKSRAEFGDLISASPLQSGNVAGQGTRLKSISQQFTQGGFQTSDRALDLAISGQGFFVTKTGSQMSFTRNGSFSIDENRYMVDSNGAFVQVLPVDSTGSVTATGISSAQNLQVPLTAGQPKASTALELSATFPSDADLPKNRNSYTATIPYKFDRYDTQSYNYSSATTVYDSAGNPQQATIYYVRQSQPSGTSTTSTWDAHLFIGDQESSSDGNTTGTPKPVTLTFASDGSLTSPTSSQKFSAVLPSGASEPIGLNVTYGTTTRQAASTFTPGSFRQDGKAAGQLNNVAVGSDGAGHRHLLGWHHQEARHDHDRQLRQPERSPSAGRQPLGLHRPLGRRDRQPGGLGLGRPDPVGRPGAGQCRHHRGTGRADLGAAQLLGQRQGDRDGQQHDPDHRQPAHLIEA